MSNYSNDAETDFAAIFNALSNPHRLEIFSLLSGCCPPGTACSTDEMLSCCVGDLNQQIDIAPSTLSHHLKELKQAGLVSMERRGKQVFYSINPNILQQLKTFFEPGSLKLAV